MVNNNFYKKIHFIGIGGVSMSALAKLSIEFGASVSGSDSTDSERLSELTALGATIWCGSNPEMMKATGAEIIVYSSAIHQEDTELKTAINLGLTTFERHEFLGIIAKRFQHVIAVAGTHGKTTTTAMLAAIFKQAKKRFTAHIGGDAVDFPNLVVHGNDYFITEACEYRRSFLSLTPDVAVVLNVEPDHPDCFHNEAELNTAFSSLLCGVKENGYAVVKQGLEALCHATRTSSISLKLSDKASYTAVCDCKAHPNSCTIYRNGEPESELTLLLDGEHNRFNALCAYAVAREENLEIVDICTALSTFRGVKRRFEKVGKLEGSDVIFDYAHHPSEIYASLAVARAKYKRLAVLFQPHTYSRTLSLLSSFVTCFADADLVAILPTYAAREKESDGLTADKLFIELLRNHNKSAKTARYVMLGGLKDGADFVNEVAKDFDCVLLFGAGDVINIKDMLSFD